MGEVQVEDPKEQTQKLYSTSGQGALPFAGDV